MRERASGCFFFLKKKNEFVRAEFLRSARVIRRTHSSHIRTHMHPRTRTRTRDTHTHAHTPEMVRRSPIWCFERIVSSIFPRRRSFGNTCMFLRREPFYLRTNARLTRHNDLSSSLFSVWLASHHPQHPQHPQHLQHLQHLHLRSHLHPTHQTFLKTSTFEMPPTEMAPAELMAPTEMEMMALTELTTAV
jgi:hypothetical protein